MNNNKTIEEYAEELMKMHQKYGAPDEEEPQQEINPLIYNTMDENNEAFTDDTEPDIHNTVSEENEVTEIIPQNEDKTEKNTDTALFKGQVFTANEAYPISNAKIKIIKGNELIAFLITDDEGATKQIRIPSPPYANSLNPYSTNQSTDYTAEVYADGFVTVKDILVSAVGDTFVILQINITPVAKEVM